MAHYFVEPQRLALAVSIADWKEAPWHRDVHFHCDACDGEGTLFLVTNHLMDNDACNRLLDEELTRRGWIHSDHPYGDPARRDVCPDCQES